jgi:hypothetical protein
MRKIKGSSSYLKNQVRNNLAKAILGFFLFALALFVLAFRVFSSFQVGVFEEGLFLALFVPLAFFYFYLHKYRIYRGGWQGEKQVTELLIHNLGDDFYLLDGLYLKGGGGDIDHVVLSPGGVFVLETKNWSGTIVCNGDEWQRPGRRKFSSSPSRQVKRNVARIRSVIDGSPSLKQMGFCVEGIVVLTNSHAKLRLIDPSVAVLRLDVLPGYIKSHGRLRKFSCEQLEAVGAEIVRHRVLRA